MGKGLRLPRHFVTQCPVCGRKFDALTHLGLRAKVLEHIRAHVDSAKPPQPKNGELFGDSGVA